MKTIELYSDDILDIVNLGQATTTFNEDNGDYIKAELRDIETDTILYTFYSNKLMLQYENGDYYFGDYHFNPDNGFMEGSEHTNKLHFNLVPVLKEGNVLTNSTKITQFNIYRDTNNRIYIKPIEILC